MSNTTGSFDNTPFQVLDTDVASIAAVGTFLELLKHKNLQRLLPYKEVPRTIKAGLLSNKRGHCACHNDDKVRRPARLK